MENFIEVYDNILPSYLEDRIYHEVFEAKTVLWKYSDNITGPEVTNDFPGFVCGFRDENFKNEFDSFYSQILYNFCSSQNIILYQELAGRLFLNFPLKNSENFHYIHNDLPEPHWVCLYYVNDSDGDTIFFDDDENEIKRVSPKKGRIAFFDGSIKHCTSTPSKNKRVVLNFNFIGGYE